MQSVVTPKPILAMLKRAKSKPYSVSAVRMDSTSYKRKETFSDMPVQEILALYKTCKPHDLQRDTDRRLANPKKSGHARCSGELPTTQLHVRFVWYKNELKTLDANHRMSIWSNDGETASIPAFVDVTFHYPKTDAEFNLLYRSIDSSEARKSSQDNLFGMFNAIGLTPVSELFLGVKVFSAFKHAACLSSKPSPDEILAGAQELKVELGILDSYKFLADKTKSFSSGVWLGLLIMLKDGAVDRALLEKFATSLRLARAYPEEEAIPTPLAVRNFVAAYAAFKSPGVAGNIKKIAANVIAAYAQFVEAEVKVPRSKPARSSRSALTLAAA